MASSGPTRDPAALDCEDLDAVQADGVRSIRRAGGEDAGDWPGRVAPGVDLEHEAIGLVEPGEDDDLVSGSQPGGRWKDIRLERDPRVRGALAALHRRQRAIAERGDDVPDRPELEVGGAHRGGGKSAFSSG